MVKLKFKETLNKQELLKYVQNFISHKCSSIRNGNIWLLLYLQLHRKIIKIHSESNICK